jgi:hypothetical protein
VVLRVVSLQEVQRFTLVPHLPPGDQTPAHIFSVTQSLIVVPLRLLSSLLDFMATVPAEEHIHFSKLYLADGYWRMIVTREERWNFAYVMPSKPGEELMVVVPSALQWKNTPTILTFCRNINF